MLQQYLNNLKITALNEMQTSTLEVAADHTDIVLLSPTGTGKTLAFLLPLIQNLQVDVPMVQALILVPSRELAMQIEQVFKQMNTGFKINCCYGGHSTKTEKNNLSQAPAVLVGTPGRVAYHLDRNNFTPNTIHTLILDEFDKALEYGFKNEMSYILEHLPNVKRRMLTSATLMQQIPDFAGVVKPKIINYLLKNAAEKSVLKVKTLQAEEKDKLELLFNLICYLQNKTALVFCNHRDAVERISGLLHQKGIEHGIFHGGLEQDERERALIKFRNNSHHLLITTDLASRGLDIPDIEAIVHYQLPSTLDVYTHRNGRTARMHAKGTAYLLLATGDFIPSFIKDEPEIGKLPEKLSMPSPSQWGTLYIAAGKKDKINKMDIVGTILQKGGIQKEELGRVEVLDNSAYAAIRSNKLAQVLAKLKSEKIKNKKVKIAVSM